jgi:hypothetical protein
LRLALTRALLARARRGRCEAAGVTRTGYGGTGPRRRGWFTGCGGGKKDGHNLRSLDMVRWEKKSIGMSTGAREGAAGLLPKYALPIFWLWLKDWIFWIVASQLFGLPILHCQL